MNKKRIGILTGGGDVPPLNAVIFSAKRAADEYQIELIGFVKGWLGVLERRVVELSKFTFDPAIGGTILKSSRVNLGKVAGGVDLARRNIEALNLDGLIVIGGEDTLSNSNRLPDVPQVLISKTIDNDVGLILQKERTPDSIEVVNYFTLGFPSAARRISSFVSLREGLRTTAYSHERIIVVESMGMHAGWLALASSMGHPDFIILPEFPLDYTRFRNKVLERYEQEKNVIAVVAEGAKLNTGAYLSADENEKDDFGHPRFKGSAEALAAKLKEDLKDHMDTRNVNGVNPSYLYRSGKPANLDRFWADRLGKTAIQMFSGGLESPVFLTIQKKGRKFYPEPYPLSRLKSIEDFHRFVDPRFYNQEDYSVTRNGKKYLTEIIREMPGDLYGPKH